MGKDTNPSVTEEIRVAAGVPDDEVTYEANLRGVSPEQMAQIIISRAALSKELERQRMATNVAIDAATAEADVLAVLDGLGLTLSISAETSRSAA